jgi:signal transduction histidine kinase
MRLRRRLMLANTLATTALLAWLAAQRSVSSRGVLLLAASTPLVAYLTLRSIVLSLPASDRSPLRKISWDGTDVIAVPLALLVASPHAAALVAVVSVVAYQIEPISTPFRTALHSAAAAGLATLAAGATAHSLAELLPGPVGTSIAVTAGVVTFEFVTLVGAASFAPLGESDIRSIVRAAAVATPVVVVLAGGLTLAYEKGAFASAAIIALVPVLLIEVMRRFGRTSVALTERDKEREDLLRLVVEASERQRASLAADVHDGPLQSVLACRSLLSDLGDASLPADGDTLSRAHDWLALAAGDLRALVRGLVPEVLTQLGLEGAIRHEALMLSRGPTQTVSVNCALRARPDPATELVLYRVAHEALMNASKHSGAAQVHVHIDQEGDDVTLSVKDDGRGGALRRGDSDEHVGLAMAQERVNVAGGTFAVHEPRDGGTEVVVRLRLRSEPAGLATSRAARLASWWAQPLGVAPSPIDQ